MPFDTTEPNWAAHHRPPVRHPAAGGGLEAHGLDPNDPAGHAAAVVAGIIPDGNGEMYSKETPDA
jgi:hypothetical protein